VKTDLRLIANASRNCTIITAQLIIGVAERHHSIGDPAADLLDHQARLMLPILLPCGSYTVVDPVAFDQRLSAHQFVQLWLVPRKMVSPCPMQRAGNEIDPP
jgi:hypothetical protein